MFKELKSEKDNELKVQITIENEKFKAEIKNVFEQHKNHFKIPGFRNGKVPFQLVTKYYGVEIFFEDAANNLVTEAINEFAKDKTEELVTKVQPAIVVKEIAYDKDLVIDATFYKKPSVKLGDYKKIELAKKDEKVSKEQIEQVINQELDKNARLEEKKGKAKKDDTVNINFEGFSKNEKGELVPFEGGKGENFDLVLGSGMFIPGFEEQLIGASAKEEHTVKVTFPAEYHAPNLAGQEAEFKVLVNEVKTKKLPKLDDEFAKDLGFDSVKEWKAEIEKNLVEANKMNIKRENEQEIAKILVENSEVDITEAEVENTLDEMENSFKMQGIDFNMFAQMTGKTVKELKDTYRVETRNNLKTRYILLEIAKKEKIKVTDEEIDEELNKQAMQYSDKPSVEELKKYAPIVEEVTSNLLVKKAMEFILSKVKFIAGTTDKKETVKKTEKKTTAKAKTTKTTKTTKTKKEEK